MSLVHRSELSPSQVEANQANAQKSTGPRTLAGKVRASLNSFKHGAYAKVDSRRREMMLKRGQDPGEYEQLHQDLVNSWQPEDTMQAMVVRTIVDRTWDKLQLRRAYLDAQLGTLDLAQTQAQRRQLSARRGLRAAPQLTDQGLCGAKDFPDKFKEIVKSLDRLQQWCEDETCPDEYPDLMARLYGDHPTVAGQQIRAFFMQLFDDDHAVCEKARQELPKWIAQEKSDVQQDRELYRRERAIRGASGPSLAEDQVTAKEAALNRQIAEQTRLLVLLKSKRSLWGSEPEAGEALPGVTGVSPVEPGQGQDGHATNSSVHPGTGASPVEPGHGQDGHATNNSGVHPATGVSPVEPGHGQDGHATNNSGVHLGTGVSPVEPGHGQDAHATNNSGVHPGTGVSPVEPGHGQDGHATNSGVHPGTGASPANEWFAGSGV